MQSSEYEGAGIDTGTSKTLGASRLAVSNSLGFRVTFVSLASSDCLAGSSAIDRWGNELKEGPHGGHNTIDYILSPPSEL